MMENEDAMDMEHNERRSYQRTEQFHCDGKMSENRKTWIDIRVIDVSSSGFQMEATGEYEPGDIYRFNLTLYGVASELTIITQGIIRRKVFKRHEYLYGVEFADLSTDNRIRIDEMLHQMIAIPTIVE